MAILALDKETDIELDESQLFAVYKLPNEKDHHLILQNNNETGESDINSVFVIHPFEATNTNPIISIQPDLFITNPHLKFSVQKTYERESISKEAYLLGCNKVKDLCAGKFSKLVYSRIKAVKKSNTEIFDVFLKLKERYKDAFCFLFNIPNVGCWIGASPEFLVGQSSESLHTVALAGTRKSMDKSTAWGEKELEEQALVSDYIRSIIQTKNIIEETGPETVSAGQMEHLKTSFKFKHEFNVSQTAQRLHPTPAVCGIPTEEAKKAITDIEDHDRRYYTGYLGPVNLNGKSQLFVNLRSMEISQDYYYLYLGGGIMENSDCQLEWEETELKASTLLNVI